jgi:hypothetical protein
MSAMLYCNTCKTCGIAEPQATLADTSPPDYIELMAHAARPTRNERLVSKDMTSKKLSRGLSKEAGQIIHGEIHIEITHISQYNKSNVSTRLLSHPVSPTHAHSQPASKLVFAGSILVFESRLLTFDDRP